MVMGEKSTVTLLWIRSTSEAETRKSEMGVPKRLAGAGIAAIAEGGNGRRYG